MTIESAHDASPEEVQAAQQAFTLWNSGQQPQAFEAIAKFVDRNVPWALAMQVFLYMQQGLPSFDSAIPYAKRAQQLGMPWVSTTLFNNIIASIGQAPHLLEPAMELLDPVNPGTPGIDPMSQGWNLLAQGRPDEAVRMMSITVHWPVTNEAWDALSQTARRHLADMEKTLEQARTETSEVGRVARESLTAITKARNDLETSAKQAGLLVTNTQSDAVNALFEADAKKNRTGSLAAWIGGLVVLVAAASVAVYPLWQHYREEGPTLASTALVGAHVAATVALGTVAGVLLARARARDRARQQSTNLSIAMGTMISYSNRIQDEEQRERFMLAMGQLVLQAHLNSNTTASASGQDESLTGLAALLSVMKDLRAPENPAPK